jgi:hypothetical protein
MKYETLKNFQHIFQREDYVHISNEDNIKQVSAILVTHISNPDGKETTYKEILRLYLENVTSFLTWLQIKNIPDLREGYKLISDEIRRAITLFDYPEIKRRSISRGYCKKFNEMFLYGITKFEPGVKLVFHPIIIGSTNVDKSQLVRYIFDTIEGLGSRFLFNKIGKHAFVNKITTLSREELIILIRLLLQPSASQIRVYNGWKDIGIGQTPVRILSLQKRFFGKEKVYFLYKINEHPQYQAQLLVHPDKVAFAAA